MIRTVAIKSLWGAEGQQKGRLKYEKISRNPKKVLISPYFLTYYYNLASVDLSSKMEGMSDGPHGYGLAKESSCNVVH